MLNFRSSRVHANNSMTYKKQIAFSLLFFTASIVFSQEQPRKCWIYFRDKDETALRTLGANGTVHEISQATGITERALKRRAKVLPPAQLISAEDLPVSQSYIEQLQLIGISVINTSRWFNAVTAMLTHDQTARVSALPFVDHVELVRYFCEKGIAPAGRAPKKNVCFTISKSP